jgi:hypothetical protein
VNAQAAISQFPIDHLGLVGADIHELVAAFRALGFQVTAPGKLMTDVGDSHGVQHSAHVMVGNAYLELTAVSAATPQHHLAAYLAMPPGIRILILACLDAHEVRARISANGMGVGPVHTASRRLLYGGGEQVGFRWFAADPQPASTLLLGWVQHENPDELYHPDVCEHPNTVTCVLALHGNPNALPASTEVSEGLPWYSTSSEHSSLSTGAQLGPFEHAIAGADAEFASPVSAIEWGVRDLSRCIAALPESAVVADGVVRVPATTMLGVELIFRELRDIWQ